MRRYFTLELFTCCFKPGIPGFHNATRVLRLQGTFRTKYYFPLEVLAKYFGIFLCFHGLIPFSVKLTATSIRLNMKSEQWLEICCSCAPAVLIKVKSSAMVARSDVKNVLGTVKMFTITPDALGYERHQILWYKSDTTATDNRRLNETHEGGKSSILKAKEVFNGTNTNKNVTMNHGGNQMNPNRGRSLQM